MEYYDPREYDLAGRIAKLRTRHGTIETPYLFPVVDPRKQSPSLEALERAGFNAFITNAYILYQSNSGRAVNIHSHFNWKKPIMTDSGGYQILVYGSIEVDNETIVEYQKSIGADICVILDIPTGASMSRASALSAVRETIRRSWEALPLIMDSDQLWVLPIQGAPYLDLIYYSSLASSRIPFHVYALGSPTIYLERYSFEDILTFAIIARRNVSPNKPLHVFGVGHPLIIPFLVAVGSDLFDSASYVLYARDDRFIFEWGTRRLEELHYLPCNCPICSKYSVEELREIPKNERAELVAQHNLYALNKEIKQTKQAIREGRLWEYLEYKSKLHPSLKKSLEVLKRYRDYLKEYCPYTRAQAQAMLLMDESSVCNPKLELNREAVYRYLIANRNEHVRALLVPAINKPFNRDELYISIRDRYSDYKVLFYHPYLGLFPPEVSSTYPYFQHEIGEIVYSEGIVEEVTSVISKLNLEELLIVSIDVPVYKTMAEEIYSRLKDRFGEVKLIRAWSSLSSQT